MTHRRPPNGGNPPLNPSEPLFRHLTCDDILGSNPWPNPFEPLRTPFPNPSEPLDREGFEAWPGTGITGVQGTRIGVRRGSEGSSWPLAVERSGQSRRAVPVAAADSITISYRPAHLETPAR
jgi:hypothetical protein